MRNAFIFSILSVAALLLLPACSRDAGIRLHAPACAVGTAASFGYDMLGHPVVEVALDSGRQCRMIFDTGGAGMLLLDNRFAERCGLIEAFRQTGTLKSGWDFGRDIPCMTFGDPVSISVGNSTVTYPECHIVDGRFLNLLSADGLFSIPSGERRTWELDCQNRSLVIHDLPDLFPRGFSLRLDTVGRQLVARKFPFRFCCHGECLQPQADLVLDTGSPASIIYLYAEPDSLMRSALSCETTLKYRCPDKGSIRPTCYLLDECGVLNRRLWIEHRELLRPWRISGERDMVVAGMDFLKSFNLLFHPARHAVELIPIAYLSLNEEYSRQKGCGDLHFRAFQSSEGHAVVVFVKMGSYWQDFGLEEGDVILDVDGRRLFDLPRSYFDDAPPGTSHSFTIIRDRDTLSIQTAASRSCAAP